MLVMSSDSWTALRDGMYKRFSTGASVIIQDMGNEVGAILFNSLNSSTTEQNSDSPATIIQKLGDAMFKSGFGRYTVTVDSDKGNGLSFTVRSCVFCEGKNSEQYGCNFVRGIAVGFSSELYQKEYKSTVTCLIDKNGHQCKILLNRK